ncbi:MAG: FliM/FliN family flagellar motor switch protein [Elusimicrobiales bacterium]|nr:FliM/FliN family flagellar motor switch protein [Elusimicrobiales bacterium]
MNEMLNSINEFNKTPDTSKNSKISESFIMDIPVEISIEITKINIIFKELLNLEVGSVINLNKSPQDPLTIYANGKEVGKGEIVMLDDTIGVRVLSWKEEKK